MKIKEIILRNKIASFFFLVLLSSFVAHSWVRNDHFQECDSSVVYSAANDFPYQAMLFNNAVNAHTNLALHISRETATKIVDSPFIGGLLKASLGSRFNDQRREAIIFTLSSGTRAPLFYVRSAIIFGLISVGSFVPHFIISAFSLPLATTYSFGPGLLYGLITGVHASFQDFMSNATLLTLLLFHIGVAFIFLAARKLGASPLSAAIAGAAALFSISLSSYGYHLGSTIWNFSTSAFFVWSVVYFYTKSPADKYLKRMAWIAGALVFFNYLVVFYWAAFMIGYFLMHKDTIQGQSIMKKSYALLKGQYPALMLFLLCALAFFPPGQSGRGLVSSFPQIASFSYYILLNIVSIYNKSTFTDIIQFTAALGLVGAGLRSLFSPTDQKEKLFARNFLVAFVVGMLAVFVLGNLGIGPYFGPTRHILFVAPVLFIFVSLGVESLLIKKAFLKPTGVVLLFALVIVGGLCARQRSFDATDKTGLIDVDTSVKHVLIDGCSLHLLYKDWGPGKTASMINTPTQDFIKGDTYLYISQENRTPDTFYKPEDIFGVWRNQGYTFDILKTQSLTTGIQFTAYNPEQYPWDRQSGFSAITFKVIGAPTAKAK